MHEKCKNNARNMQKIFKNHAKCTIRHRTTTFNKESIGAAFGRAPTGGASRPQWVLSLLNVVVLCLILYNYENNLEIWLYT